MNQVICLLSLFLASSHAGGLVSSYSTTIPGSYAYQTLTHHGAAPVAYAAAVPHAAAIPASGYAYTAAAPVATYAAAPVATYAAAPVSTYTAAPVATYAAAPVATYAAAYGSSQYHAQDILGQASYGYSHPGQAHHAVRDAAGNVRGSYAYINPDGNEIRVNYVADHGGFRAESNALPQAPLAVAPAVPVAAAPVLVAPAAVAAPSVPADTPEVVEARAAHAQAHLEAKARNAVLLVRKRRGLLGYSAPLFGSAYTSTVHHPTAFSTYTVSPATYATAAIAPTLLAAPAVTQVVHNNPGHAVSYRVY